MTIEEAEHQLATRLYQNTAKVHFDQQLANQNRFGKRLIYGGHIISLARCLSFNGLGQRVQDRRDQRRRCTRTRRSPATPSTRGARCSRRWSSRAQRTSARCASAGRDEGSPGELVPVQDRGRQVRRAAWCSTSTTRCSSPGRELAWSSGGGGQSRRRRRRRPGPGPRPRSRQRQRQRQRRRSRSRALTLTLT